MHRPTDKVYVTPSLYPKRVSKYGLLVVIARRANQVFRRVPADVSTVQSRIPNHPNSGEGHGQQVARLFREHNASLVSYLRTRLFSQDEAKDVAQEAYVQLLGLNRPESVRFLRGYLFRTAANLAANRLKRRSQRRRNDELIFFDSQVQDARSPERVCAADTKIALLNQALSQLPPDCRAAFQLVRMEGLSSGEAARHLELHPRRVRRYVARALTHCIAAIEPVAEISTKTNPEHRDNQRPEHPARRRKTVRLKKWPVNSSRANIQSHPCNGQELGKMEIGVGQP